MTRPTARRSLGVRLPLLVASLLLVTAWMVASLLVLRAVDTDMPSEQGTPWIWGWGFVAGTGLLLGWLIVRESAETRLRHQLFAETSALLDAISHLTESALAHLPLDDLLDELLGRIRSVLHADNATVLLVTRDGRRLQARASLGRDDLEDGDPHYEIAVGAGIAGRIATATEPVVIGDVRSEIVESPGLRETTASLVGCPLLVEGRVIGVLHVGSATPREFTETDVQLLQLVADRAAVAIERARLDEEARRSRLGAEHARRHLSMLGEASELLATALERYEPALAQLVDVTVPAFADWCSIDVVEGDRVHREAAAHVDPVTAAREAEIHRAHPGWRWPIERVMAGGGPALYFDVRERADVDDDERDFRLVATELGLVSCIIVPIRVRGLSFGALSFGVGPGRRGYRPSDLTAAEDLAGRVAVAMERVLLYRETQQAAVSSASHAAQLRRLMSAALSVNAPLADVEIMRMVAVQARRVIGAGVAVVTLRGDEHAPPVRVVSPPDEERDLSFLDFFTAEHPERAPDSVPAVRLLREPDMPPGSWLAAPLTEGHEVRGTIFLTDHHEGEFSADDESILVLLAQLGSVALANAHLFRRVQTNEERLRALVDASPLAIIEFGLDGTLQRWNRAAKEMYELSFDDDGRGRTGVDMDAAAESATRQLLDRAVAGEVTTNIEMTLRRTDGSPLAVSAATAPLRGRDGQVNGVIGISADITDRRHLELQLQQAQRMEAMGRLAGGVAHDFNNLLTVILGYTEIFLRDLAEDHPRRHDLEAVKQAGERAATLTGQLLAISRRQMTQPVVLDPNDVVSSMEDVLSRLMGEHIELHAVPDPTIGKVLVDPGQLEQVLLNLVINARDAMPEGGRILIETSEVVVDEVTTADDTTTGETGLKAGRHVVIMVSDTGTGMDDETLRHCFEPFFTTKERGRGTGLGLATVYGIVAQAKGHMEIDSRLGHGTTFRIFLPRAADDAVDEHARFDDDLEAGAGERILLVEDEDELRELTRDVLELEGYEVLHAATGADALKIASDEEWDIDLLLTDVVMPGMSGVELARRVTEQRPSIRVLLVSGYAEDDTGPLTDLSDGAPFLAKPFRPQDLVAKVRQVLAGAHASQGAGEPG